MSKRLRIRHSYKGVTVNNDSRLSIVGLPLSIGKQFEKNGIDNKINGLSLVIPVRGKDREDNLNHVIGFYRKLNISNLQITVVEEDSKENIDVDCSDFMNAKFNKIFIKSLLPFNKSKCINAGVMSSTYDKICINDADILPSVQSVYNSFRFLDKYDMTFLFNEVYWTSKISKKCYAWNRKVRNDAFSGGCIFIKRKSFESIGGMSEEFEGYGSEDCEFWGRAKSLLSVLENRMYPLVHLWHGRKYSLSQNSHVYDKLVAMKMEDRVEHLKTKLMKYNKG